MTKHSAPYAYETIACEIVKKSIVLNQGHSADITHLRLQKLMYFAYG